MTLPRLALRCPAIVVAVFGLTSAWGVFAFSTMPRRADPSFTIRTAQVITRWPGATATKVEQLVTDPLETEIDTLDEVRRVSSTTTTGLSVIDVLLDDSVQNIENVWSKVRARVDTVIPALPEGVSKPAVNDTFGDVAVMLLAVHQAPAPGADAYTPRQLEQIADRIADDLRLIPSIARADLHGAQQEVIYVETDMGTWSRLELTTDALERLVRSRNTVAPGGSIDTARSRFSVKPSGAFDAVDQIERIIVDADDRRAPTILSDLGIRVHRGYEDPPTTLTRYGDRNGSAPSITLALTMKDGANVVDLGRTVLARIERLQRVERVVPPDIAVRVVADEPRFVDRKIGSFTTNVIQAIILVVGVAMVMIGLRIALVMAAAIPVVLLTSIGICHGYGIELQQMSIASLIIALGLLVDNAIEVCDNAHRLQHEGRSRVQAVIQGTEQVMFPVLMATLTTLCAFAPMMFMLTGQRRDYVFAVPFVVSTTLAVSWITAVTLTPLTARRFLRPAGPGRAPRPSPMVRVARRLHLDGFPDWYRAAAIACVRRKWVTAGTAAVLLVAALLLPVGSQFFPADLRETFLVDVWLPEGTSFGQTDRTTAQVEQIIRRLSPVEAGGTTRHRLGGWIATIGGSGPRFALNVDPQPPASNFAQLLVQATDRRLTAGYVADIREAAARQVAGARVIPRRLVLGPPFKTPLAIRILGPGFADMTQLRAAADRIKRIFRDTPGTWDVHDDWGGLGYQLAVTIDAEKANLSGVTHAGATQTLKAYFSGHRLTTYREDDHRVPVDLRLPRRQRRDVPSVAAVYAEGSRGKVPLDQFASVTPRRRPAKIRRRDMNRVIQARARVEPGVLANTVLAEMRPRIDRVVRQLPPGFRIEISGEQEKTDEAGGETARSFGVSALLIVLCLVVMYNGWARPVLILLTLPMAAVGAFLGLWLTGNPLSFMAMLGLVSLAGIVLNTAIVYVEFAEMLLRRKRDAADGAQGPPIAALGIDRDAFHACLADAGRMRLMPICLTTFTTIGGLIPLALSGGPMWEGMACVLIFGLLLATLLTLLVLPAIYAIFVETFGMKPLADRHRRVGLQSTP